MTPAWDVIGLIVGVISIVSILVGVWYAYDNKYGEMAQNKRLMDLYDHPHHSPEAKHILKGGTGPDADTSASETYSFSASPTESLSASPTISYSPEAEETEWIGSSGTIWLESIPYTGISGSGYVPNPKDEKCQWCGHRYPLVLNGVEVYYCPKCGGPRK